MSYTETDGYHRDGYTFETTKGAPARFDTNPDHQPGTPRSAVLSIAHATAVLNTDQITGLRDACNAWLQSDTATTP